VWNSAPSVNTVEADDIVKAEIPGLAIRLGLEETIQEAENRPLCSGRQKQVRVGLHARNMPLHPRNVHSRFPAIPRSTERPWLTFSSSSVVKIRTSYCVR
jgi:hypothetical protein